MNDSSEASWHGWVDLPYEYSQLDCIDVHTVLDINTGCYNRTCTGEGEGGLERWIHPPFIFFYQHRAHVRCSILLQYCSR